MPSGVVPYVGTWIEIQHRFFLLAFGDVVPYVGTWIEMLTSALSASGTLRRSLRGNVDRNICRINSMDLIDGRSLRGNVDRNKLNNQNLKTLLGRSLRGNVDRNQQ